MGVDIIKVSARSRTASVAGAVAGIMRDSGRAEVQAIGAGAVNQAIKAIAIARGYLLEEETDIVCIPSFVEIEINGAERTALRMLVIERHSLMQVSTDVAKTDDSAESQNDNPPPADP